MTNWRSRSIDQPRSDPDSENRRGSRSPQRSPSFRSATPPQEADRPIRIRSISPLPPSLCIRQAASTLTQPTATNHDNINIVAHNIVGMTKTCHYCDAKLWPTKTSSLYDIGEMAIQIPTELCQPDTEALITLVYNDFNENYTKEEYLSQRANLTTAHENVDHINDKMIKN